MRKGEDRFGEENGRGGAGIGDGGAAGRGLEMAAGAVGAGVGAERGGKARRRRIGRAERSAERHEGGGGAFGRR